ncbi:MAG: hypothetical protein LBI57_08030 [Helicobacteraceae bacterium]|nr:hypothetical protein [Helicobacteraceae bacterium]
MIVYVAPADREVITMAFNESVWLCVVRFYFNFISLINLLLIAEMFALLTTVILYVAPDGTNHVTP